MARKWQGMNWIRQEKRLALYLRDGLACVWCGEGIEDGARLSLDHLKPRSKLGSHHETNLVTCCEACNKARGNRTMARFARVVAAYLGGERTAKQILKGIENARVRVLGPHLKEAKKLIARRGSAAKAVEHLWRTR